MDHSFSLLHERIKMLESIVLKIDPVNLLQKEMSILDNMETVMRVYHEIPPTQRVEMFQNGTLFKTITASTLEYAKSMYDVDKFEHIDMAIYSGVNTYTIAVIDWLYTIAMETKTELNMQYLANVMIPKVETLNWFISKLEADYDTRIMEVVMYNVCKSTTSSNSTALVHLITSHKNIVQSVLQYTILTACIQSNIPMLRLLLASFEMNEAMVKKIIVTTFNESIDPVPVFNLVKWHCSICAKFLNVFMIVNLKYAGYSLKALKAFIDVFMDVLNVETCNAIYASVSNLKCSEDTKRSVLNMIEKMRE